METTGTTTAAATTTDQPPGVQRRRRNRKPKACRTCRRSKVRCNYQQPCDTCVRRQQPQLCIYEAQPVRNRRSSAQSSPKPAPEIQVQHSIDSIAGPIERSAHDLLVILDHIAAAAVASCETDTVAAQAIFVGRYSHAAVFRTLLPHLPSDALPPDVSVEAAFGLTNYTRTHPFASLWNTTARITLGDILNSLPSTETCLHYYRSYQQIIHPFFPFLHDTEAFERNLCAVLEQLGAHKDEPQSFSNRLAADVARAELAGYALLFAVLASGCQVCDVTEGDQLALTTRVLFACSFECLRLANFYVSPSPETIQATLILENVTCNDSNPGVAMNILGITARQAQGLGMHTKSPSRSNICLCRECVHPLWRAVISLDSTLSVAYDRMPVGFIPEYRDLLQPLVRAPRLEFWDCMFALQCLQIQWQSAVSRDTSTLVRGDTIESYLASASRLGESARSAKSSLCRPESVQATLEQLVFTIDFECFEGSLLCQAAVSPTLPTESRLRHFHNMTLRFCSVIDAYVKLRRLSPIAKVAWGILHAAVTSALLLAAFELILHTNLSDQSLHHLSRALSQDSTSEQTGNDAAQTSWRAGFNILDRLLQFQSLRVPVTAAAEGN